NSNNLETRASAKKPALGANSCVYRVFQQYRSRAADDRDLNEWLGGVVRCPSLVLRQRKGCVGWGSFASDGDARDLSGVSLTPLWGSPCIDTSSPRSYRLRACEGPAHWPTGSTTDRIYAHWL